MTLAPDDPRHGTVNGYKNHYCRCDKCRTAATMCHREWRHRRHLALGDPRHGTQNGYVNYNCRCPACKEAQAEYMRVRRRKWQS